MYTICLHTSYDFIKTKRSVSVIPNRGWGGGGGAGRGGIKPISLTLFGLICENVAFNLFGSRCDSQRGF